MVLNLPCVHHGRSWRARGRRGSCRVCVAERERHEFCIVLIHADRRLAAVYRGWLLVISDYDQVPFLRATRRARVPAESSSVDAVVRRTAGILPSMSARPRCDSARATTSWLRAALTRAARRSARRPPRRPPSLGTPTAEHKGVRRILLRAGFISPRTLKRR